MISPCIPFTSDDAIYRLQTIQQQTVNRFEALEFLAQRLTTYQLLSLYSTFFPAQFAASETSPYIRVNSEGHSEQEIEFLMLLNTLFPISDWTIDRAYEDRIESIPILDMGIAWQSESGIEALVDQWQVLIPLTSDGQAWFDYFQEDYRRWYRDAFGIKVKFIQQPDKVPPKLLRQRFLKLGSPFQFLPLALRLLDKSTNNVWLDQLDESFYGSEARICFDWSETALRYLHRQWQQAQRVLNCCFEFSEWLKQDLPKHFNLLMEYWNKPYP